MAFLQPGQGRGPRYGGGKEPAFNAPAVVLWLIGALIAVHVVLAVLPEATANEIRWQLAFTPARISGIDGLSLATLGALASVFTYVLVHLDVTSLAMEGLLVLAFGSVVAQRFGALRFVLLFVLGGAAGALLLLATNWNSITPVAGGSASVSGLAVAAIRMMWRSASWPVTFPPKLAPVFSPQILVFAAVWVAIGIVAAGAGNLLGGGGGHPIVWQPTLGGTLAGLALSSLFDLSVPKIALVPGRDA